MEYQVFGANIHRVCYFRRSSIRLDNIDFLPFETHSASAVPDNIVGRAMGQRISCNKSPLAPRPPLGTCTSIIRGEAIEVAPRALLISGNVGSSIDLAALPRPDINFNVKPIPQADLTGDLEKSGALLHCACWKCHGRGAYGGEGNIRFKEAVAHLDYILEKFADYFRQARESSEDEPSAVLGQHGHDPFAPLSNDAYKEESPLFGVALPSVQSPPCTDNEPTPERPVQSTAITTLRGVSPHARSVLELCPGHETPFRNRFVQMQQEVCCSEVVT